MVNSGEFINLIRFLDIMEAMPEIDFGVYHHSSKEKSETARQIITQLFEVAFSRVGAASEVLDVGCGLGFLSYLAASHYKSSKITAVDTFEENSLRGNSIEKAINNMKLLEISDRVTFVVSDIRNLKVAKKYDLAVSNLVLHNLGWGTKYKVYETIWAALKPGGYFINGDLFIRTNIFLNPFEYDVKRLANIFNVDFVLDPPKYFPISSYRLVAFKRFG